jgi:DNA-binding PadR family transcriptional regulator
VPEDEESTELSKAMTRLVKKLTKEMLWIYILRLLQERPHYGYEIKELVTKRFSFSPATVSGYAIIYRLTKDGLIEEQRTGDSPRKYYGITEKGLLAMREAKEFLVRTMGTVFDITE